MSDDAQHIENLRHFSQRGGVLDTRAATATTNNPQWGRPLAPGRPTGWAGCPGASV